MHQRKENHLKTCDYEYFSIILQHDEKYPVHIVFASFIYSMYA